MAKRSAGIVLIRRFDGEAQVLLVHPGGPFWARKDAGSWSIPKGEYHDGEQPLEVAEREFREELGAELPRGIRHDLGTITQSGGKEVHAWCVHGEIDVATFVSNTFEMEWPPRSGRMQQFPEVDRAAYFAADDAAAKILPGQRPLLDRAFATLP